MSNLLTIYLNFSSSDLHPNKYFFGVFNTSGELQSTGFISQLNGSNLNTTPWTNPPLSYDKGDYLIIIKQDNSLNKFYLTNVFYFDTIVENTSGKEYPQINLNAYGTSTNTALGDNISSTINTTYNINDMCSSVNKYVKFYNVPTTANTYGPIDTSNCNGYILGNLIYDPTAINSNICVNKKLLTDINKTYPNCPNFTNVILWVFIMIIFIIVIIILIIVGIKYYKKHKNQNENQK